MKRIFFVSLFIMLSIITLSQTTTDNKADSSALKKHVYTLCADSMSGRLSGTEGQKLAADYIVNEFEDNGLLPLLNNQPEPYYQKFKCYQRSKELPQLWCDDQIVSVFGHFVYVGASDKTANNEKVSIGIYRSSDDLNDFDTSITTICIKAKDHEAVFSKIESIKKEVDQRKFIIVLPQSKLKKYLRTCMSSLDDKLLLEKKNGKVKEYSIWSRGYSNDDNKILNDLGPYAYNHPDCEFFFFSDETIMELLKTEKEDFDAIKNEDFNEYYFFGVYTPKAKLINTENVIGMIEGTEHKDEYIMIAGHYDHMGTSFNQIRYGADDNASGVSMILELSRMVSEDVKNGNRPKRSILFVAFSAEEMGLLGSKYFVENSPVLLNQIKELICLDMVGRGDSPSHCQSDSIYFMAYKRNHKKIEQQAHIYATDKFDLVLHEPERFFDKIWHRYGSDHAFFVAKGVPTMILHSGDHEDYHRPTDTPDKLNYAKMTRSTDLLYHLINQIANE